MSPKKKSIVTKEAADLHIKNRILVVEDDTAVMTMVVDFLTNRNYEVISARTGEEGLLIGTTEKPDVILVDILMPGIDGIELIERLRDQRGTKLIPIIVLTAVNDLETKLKVFRAGGDGMLIKPFDLQELQIRIERALQVSHNFMELTYVDSLTGVYNRRFFDDRLLVEINRSRRYGNSLSLVLFDIDFFKKFNDTYGHRAGDFVLNALSTHVKKQLRSQDIVCRYGGEEFGVIMPMTRGYDAAMVLSRLRSDLQSRYFYSEYDNRNFNILISVGIAEFPTDARDDDALVRAADEALYEAKNTGRNKVVLYHAAEPPSDEGESKMTDRRAQ
jgi:diguanylate cyclase (GGDEF)-like protein